MCLKWGRFPPWKKSGTTWSPIWSYSKVNHDFDWLIQSTKGGVGASLHLKRVGINWPHDFNKKSHMFFYWKAILFKAIINMDRPNFLTWNSCGSDIPKLRATEPTPELYWYFKNLKKKNHYKNSKSLGQHLFNANSMELFVLVFFSKKCSQLNLHDFIPSWLLLH